MKPNFKRVKAQIKADDKIITETIEKINTIKSKKRTLHFKQVYVLAASLCFIILICFTVPMIMQTLQEPLPTLTDDTQENNTAEPNTDNTIQSEQSYNDGVTMSAALAQIIAKSSKNEPILIQAEIMDLMDVYASNYVDRLYNGKTYDEWWAEYDAYKIRMIRIEVQLRHEHNAELEKEYKNISEKAENLKAYMSQIKKEQIAESIASEIAWLKSLGIEAEYKKGYLVFFASADDINNISKGKCDYVLDIEENKEDPDVEKIC